MPWTSLKQQLFGQQFFHNKWLNLGLSRLYSERLCCKNFFPPSILWRQILEATSDFLILAWRNEDQSRRLARGWSMVWLSSRVTGHTWGESYEHLLKMLEEAIQGWLEVASERELLSLDSS